MTKKTKNSWKMVPSALFQPLELFLVNTRSLQVKTYISKFLITLAEDKQVVWVDSNRTVREEK